MAAETLMDWRPELAEQGLYLWYIEMEHVGVDDGDLRCVSFTGGQPDVCVRWDPMFPLFPGNLPPGNPPRWGGYVVAHTAPDAIKQAEEDVRIVLRRWRLAAPPSASEE